MFKMSNRLIAGACLFCVVISNTAYSQSNSTGLKLGQDTETAPKLDLGAAPAPVKKPLGPSPAAPPAAVPQANATLAPAASNAAERKVYGAWEVACMEKGKNCAMAQIGSDSNGTPVLEMVIRKLADPLEADGRTAIAVLDVITPLGVVLTAGLSVQIDTSASESAPFQICTEQGCLVREPIDEGLIDRFRRGNVAKITVVAANQGDVSTNISLAGFTKAFAALK